MTTRTPRALAVALTLVGAACGIDDGVLGGLARDPTSMAVGGADDGSAGSGAGASSVGAKGQCTIPGPLVTIESGSGTGQYDACTGRIAATYFLNALCSCGRAQFGNFLQTRGFDSSRGPYQPDQADDSGASVGINGPYVLSAGQTDVGGSLSLASAESAELVGSLQVRGDLRATGNVTVAGTATVARNVWLAGNFVGLGPLSVGGIIHHQGSVLALPLSAQSDVQEAVSVPEPCPCQPGELLDVPALIGRARVDNDNAKANLQANALGAVAGSRSVTLPCGRYYLDRIRGAGNVVLQVTGAVALFVGASLDLIGNLEVQLSPGAEIDVFLGQDLRVTGRLALSRMERPAAGRLYLAGSADVVLNSPFIGNLYAPAARVSSVGALEVWGSLVAGEFASSSSASFVYDRAVLTAGSACNTPAPPAGSCGRCGWCSGGTACVEGVCGACYVDEDCCSQSVCSNGSCVALVEVR
jgi:hypothetical protein